MLEKLDFQTFHLERNTHGVDKVDILAFNLKRIRKKLRKTQEAMADYLGVKRSTYARYEVDIQAPNEVIEAIHKKFKIPYSEFTKEVPEVFSKSSNISTHSGEGAPKLSVVPRTVDELLELHRKHEATQEKLIETQARELQTVYKYVGELEDKLGIK